MDCYLQSRIWIVIYNPALEVLHLSSDVIITSYHSPTPTYSRHKNLMDLYEKYIKYSKFAIYIITDNPTYKIINQMDFKWPIRMYNFIFYIGFNTEGYPNYFTEIAIVGLSDSNLSWIRAFSSLIHSLSLNKRSNACRFSFMGGL